MEFTRLVFFCCFFVFLFWSQQPSSDETASRSVARSVRPSLKRTVCGVQVCGVWGVCTSGGLELKVHMIRAQREVEGDGR